MGIFLVIGLTIAAFILTAAWFIKRGRWIQASLAMLGISLIPLLWEIIVLGGAESSANASLGFITILLWPFVLIALLVGVTRRLVDKSNDGIRN